jgi:GT2 family glycosyltransferase
MQDKDIEAKNKKLFKVDYTGMGWMLVKYGVIEKMKYPWLHPRIQKHKAGWEEFVWDDVEFCMRIRDLGLDVWVDPTIIPGHEKTVVM